MNELQERLQARQESSRAFIPPLPMDSPRIGVSRALAPIKIAKPKMSRAEELADMDEKRAKATERKKAARREIMNRVFREIKRSRPCTVAELCSALRMKPISLRTYVSLLVADGRVMSRKNGKALIICLPEDKSPKANGARSGEQHKRRPTRAEIFERRAQLAQERLEQVRATVERLAPCTAAEVAEAISEGTLGTVKSRLWRLYKAGQVAKVMFGSTAKWGVPGVDYGKLTTRDRMLEYMRAAEGEGWVRIIDVMRALGFSCKSSGSVWGAIYECLAGGIIERNGRKGTAARWRVVRGV